MKYLPGISVEIVLIFVCYMHYVQSATLTRNEDIKSSIDKVQNQIKDSPEIHPQIFTGKIKSDTEKLPVKDLNVDESTRRHKMLDFYGYFPQQAIMPGFQPPRFYPQNYYEDFNMVNDEEDDVISRASNRRKPGSSQNSPIFYIRLPPTPYMFVPGMGYISQPPSYQPLTTQYPMPQHLPPPQPIRHINQFVNVPVNFLANGKPSNIYQWNAAPSLGNGFGPQYPSYLPARPHQPSYRPHKPSYGHQDSKITHLKGPFVFNGRPEDIFVLPNSPYHVPFNSPYNGNEYSESQSSHSRPNFNHMSYNTPYNSPFIDSLYPEPMHSYY